MKQRKKQPILTRQAILDAAGEEFARNGYAGTGLGQIVSRASLTKGALFHHFPDKRTLAVAWIREHLGAAIGAKWTAPLEFIQSLEALKVFFRSKCLELTPTDAVSALVSQIAETAASDPLMREACESIVADWRAAVADLLERGKSENWIHRSIQPPLEAAFLVSAFSGFTVTTKSSPDESTRRACASALEAYLETLRAQ